MIIKHVKQCAGYAVDLMNLVSKELNLPYILEDKGGIGHGVPNTITGEWNGLIGEIIAKRGDVVTITLPATNVLNMTPVFKKKLKVPSTDHRSINGQYLCL